MVDYPVCESAPDLEAHDGETVAVVGTYSQVDMNAHPRRGPVYRGHVGVELADGTLVYLGPTWSDDSQRPEDEIERLEDKHVRAIGALQEEMPDPPQEVAHILGACLHPVDSVEQVGRD